MPPEQCQGVDVDKRADVYSLGATLYYMLVAKLPFQGSAQSVLAQIAGGKRPPAVNVLNRYVPKEVAQLVGRAMSFDKRERFGTQVTISF